MYKQLKITSKNSFHSHASFLFPGPFPSAQKRGSICFLLQLSPHGSRCIDLLLSCSPDRSQWWLSSTFQVQVPSPWLSKGLPPFMEASAFMLLAWLAATLLHCQKAPAVANTSVSCEAQEKQKGDFFFSSPVWMNKSFHSHNLPSSLVSELWTASTTPAKNWMYNAC